MTTVFTVPELKVKEGLGMHAYNEQFLTSEELVFSTVIVHEDTIGAIVIHNAIPSADLPAF